MAKSRVAYTNRYNSENYDRVNVMVSRGKKEKLKEHAEITGESVNGFINRAIRETMERDKARHGESRV